ncbi:MAG: PhoH family protein, partial [Pseudomonadales bacterium]|nr:PhoH family protein [Pseudomonadales bacterium]
MEKIYVLDTNVLLHDPMALQAFQEHHVVLPMTVLEELDVIKDRREKDVSREARIAINNIDSYLENASPTEIVSGVRLPELPNGCEPGTLAIYPDQAIKSGEVNVNYLNTNIHHANDNRIINAALTLQSENPGAYVCLVTKVINMRLKAKGSGLEQVEDYRNDKVLDDIDLLAKGYEHVPGSFWDTIGNVTTEHEDGFTVHTVENTDLVNVHPNMFITDDEGFVGVVLSGDKNKLRIVQYSNDFLSKQCHWGIKPRNSEQSKAMYLLNQEDIDLTVLTGPAGSGKTLLALAYGLEEIMENNAYDKMIVARSTPPLAEEIGFLPGTEEEKMA